MLDLVFARLTRNRFCSNINISGALDNSCFNYSTGYRSVLTVIIVGVEERVGPLSTFETVFIFTSFEKLINTPVEAFAIYFCAGVNFPLTIEVSFCSCYYYTVVI